MALSDDTREGSDPKTVPESGGSGRSTRRFARHDTGGSGAHISSRLGLVAAWAVLFGIFSIALPDTFPRFSTVQIIFGSQAELVMLSLALLLPFVCGEFDLSVAGILGVCVMLVAQLHTNEGWPLWAATLAGFLTGPAMGLVNSLFIIVIGVDSIIVTLGTGTALAGLAIGINVEPVGGLGGWLVSAFRTNFLGLPLAFFYTIALAALVWYVLERTPFGRRLYFVGAGREVAKLAGLRVNRIRFISLMISATISSFAGVALAGYLGGSDPNIAPTYLLPAFAGAFLGATAITPGRFNAWGTVVAAYFLITAETGLELMGQTGWVQQVVSGGALVIAVAAARIVSWQHDRVSTARERSRRRSDGREVLGA